MTVAVLGGGLQGCCTALALAEHGTHVVLFEQCDSLLSRTAVANEGKIHLGYMYASDPTLETARTMIKGALSFAPFFERYLGIATDRMNRSVHTNYLVHKKSQRNPDAIIAYLREVHRLVSEASDGCARTYFGLNLAVPLRCWSPEDRAATFNPAVTHDVIETPEIAINPEDLAHELRICLFNHPRIEVHLRNRVLRADQQANNIRVSTDGPDGRVDHDFQHVVNALWDGRLVIDETMGLKPRRRWLHRLKYGIDLKLPRSVEVPPSVTVVSGPFGEVVTFPENQLYLTWYPECLQGISWELQAPDWPTYPGEPIRFSVLKRTIAAIFDLLQVLNRLDCAALNDARVKGAPS